MNVFGFNIKTQDLWANKNRDNQFKIDGMTADEWVKAGKGTYDEFWHVIRPQQLQSNFEKIWSSSSDPSRFPLDGVFRMFGSTNTKAVLQTLNAMDQWEKFAEISQHGGKAVGFDIETYGKTNSGHFGITEFGIGTKSYDDMGNVQSSGRSITFGIDKTEYDYLMGLVKKYRKSGWDSLDEYHYGEQTSLKRMSMYAVADGEFSKMFKQEFIPEYGNKEFMTIAGGLLPETRNADVIEQGIKNLHKAHQQSKYKISEGLPIIMQEIVNANKNDNTVIFGANSKFDISGISTMARSFGIDTKEFESIQDNVLDIVESARALGEINDESVNTYFELMDGVRAGASVEEQNRAYRMRNTQTHQAYQDVLNEGDIVSLRVKEVLDSKSKLEERKARFQQYSGIEDSVFLLNRSRINQEKAQEMAVIKGTPVANYSIGNEYWTIDTEHSHYVELDGEQKYALVLSNYADNDTSVVLIRDSEQEAIEEVTRNSSVFNQKQVTQTDAKNQQSFKYKDFGRREFDKLISPSSVAMDNGSDIYGFETLKAYLTLSEELPKDIITGTDSKSVEKLLAYMEEHYPDKKNRPIKSYYQAQSFVGMYQKIQNEKPLLSSIVEQVEKQYGSNNGVTNIDKTIVARKAYTDSISYLDSTYGRRQSGEFYNVMSDALGIDIVMPDESIKRINGYNANTISADINRFFKDLNTTEMVDIVNDMQARGLFQNEETYNQIIHRIETMSSDDLYGVSQDLGYALSNVTQEYIDSNKSIVHAFRNDKKTKNEHMLGQKLESDMNIKYTKKSFKDAYALSADSIDKIISDSISNAPNTIYINTIKDTDVLKKYIEDIAANLNITPNSSESSLLYELFTKTTNAKGEPTRYAINNYVNKGLSVFLTQADNGNAYLFMTREQDAAKFYGNLMDGRFDFTNRHTLISGDERNGFLSINDYATFVEIEKINEYQLSNGEVQIVKENGIEKVIAKPGGVLRTINQGSIEKIIIPELQTSYDSNGQIRAYYNSGEFGYLSTLRMSMGGAIEHTLHGEYKEGSSTVRKSQNNYLDELSSSASYRGRVMLDTEGNVLGVRRVAELTPNDFMFGNRARVSEGLYSLFKEAVRAEPDKDLNTAQKIVMEFGKKTMHYDIQKQDSIAFMNKVLKGTEFEEFFTKRLFVGTVSEDKYITGLNGPEFDKNIFQIIKDMASDETTHIFDKSVAQALDKIPTSKIIDQVISESAIEKGDVNFGARHGDYNDAASLYSTMRPTYSQQNNALYFSKNEIDMTKFVGFDLKDKPIRFDTAVIAEREYADRISLSNAGYEPIPGKDYSTRRRSMVARTKQMNDYELQLKYEEMRLNSKDIAQELNISEAQYNKALEYFQRDYMSLHEGKIFLAPGLNEQQLFQDRDAKKFTYNLEGLDITRSERIMKKLVYSNSKVTRDDVIGIRKDGTVVYHEGPDTVFTKANLDDIFYDAEIDQSLRKTYIIPIQGDVFDNKVMINGAEKGTTHSINMTKFMEYTGIKNHDTSLRVANSLFSKAFDGAVVVGNFGFEGHGNIASIHSIWNTITSQYIEHGYGETLEGHLNRLVNEEDAFKGFGKFKFINGELLSSSSNAHNFSAAVEFLYNQISNNSVLRSDVNENIMTELQHMNENRLFNGVLQRANMNEHLGTKMRIDQRIEQGIRTRGMQMGGAGMEAIDNDWADMLKVYSENYKAKGTGISGDLGDFINAYGKIKNASRIQSLTGKTDIQRSAKGIIESMMYYYNPTKYSPDGKNIVRININELIDEGVNLKGGLSTKDLHNSIFFINGKPSDFLRKAAKKSNVDLYNGSYSVFIDLNNTSFEVSEIISNKKSIRTFNGVMIPIQSVSDNVDEKAFFQTQQKAVAKYINDLVKITKNPQEYKDVKKALASSYSDLIRKLSKEIGYLDKDSDIYRAFQQYIMPTSRELLAQDEAAPLVKAMMTDDMRALIDEKNALEKTLMVNPDNKVAITKLDEIHKKLEDNLSDIARRIETDDSYYSELMSLSSNRLLREASKVEINGKTHYGLAIAISRESFESHGISIGAVGLDAFSDWEANSGTKKYRLEGMDQFNFASKKASIAKKLNALNIEGLKIDSSKSITQQLNEYIAKQYKPDGTMLSIKDLNRAIIEGKGPKEILQVFDEFGEEYLSKIGTYGELTRYPSFRSQAMVKVILDKQLTGNQVRGSSAILSSFSNVDFDGDKQFLAMLTDGISIVNKNTSIRLNDGRKLNVLDVQTEIYNRFATRESRVLLAELIKKGEVFDVDNPNATTMQYAAMLKKMKPAAYEEAVMQWAKDNSIRVSSFEKLSESKAMLYAASNSKQMHDAFINMEFNTMTDKDSILSSIASRFRKRNIGSISTPNYHMRNALLIAMQDPALSLEKKQLLNDTYVSLSNMLSKAGGFFSQAEQKSIDVKHSKDGLEIALTTRYSAGMSTLFGRSKHDTKSNIRGIRNILEATNAGLFKATNAELDKMASMVASTSTKEFNQYLATVGKETESHLRALRNLLDVQREIPNFDKIYADSLIKGSLDDNIFEMIERIEELNSTDIGELEKLYRHTGMYNVLDLYANSFSADKSVFAENNIYFKVGNFNDEWIDKGYLYTDNNFYEIDLDTGKRTGKTLSKEKHSQLIDAVPGGVNLKEYTESPVLKKQINDTLIAKKFESTLNNVLLDENGKVLSKIPENFTKVGSINGGIAKYGSVWSGVNSLLVGKASEGRNTSAIYQNVTKLAQTYNYAVTKGFIDTSKRPDSAGELIKQINKSIAENPRSRDSESGFVFSEEYDTILRRKMVEIFGGDEVLDRYINESQNLSSFDESKYKKYKESKDFLKENTYDIIEQRKAIDGSISSVQVELEGLRQQGVSDEDLKSLQSILDSSSVTTKDLLDTLQKENISVIKQVESDIYSLFESTKQMEYFFGWNNASGNSIVGFGEYIGKSFKDLSKTDIEEIKKAGELAKKAIKSQSTEEYAITRTLDALNKYNPQVLYSARDAMKTSQVVNDFIENNKKAINAVHEQLEKRTPEEAAEASKKAAQSVKRKTLSGQIKETFGGIPKKNIAIVAGSLAALGVVNNLLHNEKRQSPLTPAKNPDSRNKPSTQSPAKTQAPMSKRRTVYHDNGSGFNFKVSAKTSNYINEQNNAKLIGMSGGGNASIYSQSDMSGVTDNWLENKFAELA